MDKFVIRLSAVVINIYILIVFVLALNGIDVSVYDHLFSSSSLFGLTLTTLSHSQGKYHCKWIRGLCYNSLTIPTFCYVDSSFGIFDDAFVFLLVLSFLWCIGIATTLIWAVKHFYDVQKIINRYKYEKIQSIKCGCRKKD